VKVKRNLKEELKANTTVKRGETVLQQGTPLDHSTKHAVPEISSKPRAGLSVGVTLNMGDFQSLRVDCWYSAEIEDEDYLNLFYERLSDALQQNIKDIGEKFQEE
jgi:predicted proteasome-type protease